MVSGFARQKNRLEGSLQLLLQGPVAIGGGKSSSQFGSTGITLFAQLQGNVEGQGRLGNVVEVVGIGSGVGAKQSRQGKG